MKDRYRFGLVGHNIAYSKSSEVFDAIFDHEGVKGEFVNFDLSPRGFDTKFRSLLRERIDGLSVTIPHKKRVLPLLNDVHPVAEALEAVNSVAVQHGRTSGFNTDVYGFSFPLVDYADRLKHGGALILGCGGGARAALYALYTDYEVGRFTVLGKTKVRLKRFRSAMRRMLNGVEIEIAQFEDYCAPRDGHYAMVVNATPLGGWNHPDASPLPTSFNWGLTRAFYDLNYNENNALVKAARQAGIIAIDGSVMLTAQALRSFEIWTERKVAFEPVHEEVFGCKEGS